MTLILSIKSKDTAFLGRDRSRSGSQQDRGSSRASNRTEGKGVRAQGAETALTGDGGLGVVTDTDEACNTCSR